MADKIAAASAVFSATCVLAVSGSKPTTMKRMPSSQPVLSIYLLIGGSTPVSPVALVAAVC
jgi:hypothetical protein